MKQFFLGHKNCLESRIAKAVPVTIKFKKTVFLDS
jgi:hypothetical protein